MSILSNLKEIVITFKTKNEIVKTFKNELTNFYNSVSFLDVNEIISEIKELKEFNSRFREKFWESYPEENLYNRLDEEALKIRKNIGKGITNNFTKISQLILKIHRGEKRKFRLKVKQIILSYCNWINEKPGVG